MDVLTVAALVVAGVALLLLALLHWRGGRSDGQAVDRLLAAQGELAGRLAQVADSQAAAQARLAEQLQAQEREIGKRLEERLAEVSKRVGESLEKSSSEARTSLSDLKERLAVIGAAQKSLTELSDQVVSLQQILSNKQARGAFGEVQLRDLVTACLPPSAYGFQATLASGVRADCLLRLPNPPGAIAVDAKFPLEGYHALQQATDDAGREAARRQLAADILKHVKDIAAKYIVPGETAESALMFLPSEAIYAELHANLPQVVEQSYRHRVWIVSPTTMMATLNTIRAVLKDARMREQAGVIQREVGLLLEDVARLDDRVGKLQRHFDQASEDVRQIRISTDKVTKRGERIQDIEVEDAAAELPPAAPVERLQAAGE